MNKKHEFKAPADLIEGREEMKAAEVAIASGPLLGTWSNCDQTTRGLVRIVIAASGAGISVHAFGACVPTPCDWGRYRAWCMPRTSAPAWRWLSAPTVNLALRTQSWWATSTWDHLWSRRSITLPTGVDAPTITPGTICVDMENEGRTDPFTSRDDSLANRPAVLGMGRLGLSWPG